MHYFFSSLSGKEGEYISGRLFRRPNDERREDDGGLPFRSSSETSVFDFRESDSEGEMPVLERQTLDEMRRDRRGLNKQNGQLVQVL